MSGVGSFSRACRAFSYLWFRIRAAWYHAAFGRLFWQGCEFFSQILLRLGMVGGMVELLNAERNGRPANSPDGVVPNENARRVTGQTQASDGVPVAPQIPGSATAYFDPHDLNSVFRT